MTQLVSVRPEGLFMMRMRWLLSVLLCATQTAGAQTARPAAGDPRAAMQAEARTAMAPFAWLVGEWEGPATVHTPNGGTMSLTQRETVTSSAFGTALFIQGRGSMTTNGASRQVWDAAGLVGYDVPTKKFSFASAGGMGMMQMFAVTTQGEGFTWGYTDPAGTINQFVITRTSDDKWKEVGSTSSDGGKTWTVTIELLLTRRP
jgi:hypothetical protein